MSQTHFMNLRPIPFAAIFEGRKTVELRLNDEKRQQVRVGDRIRFTQTESGEQMTVTVTTNKTYTAVYKDISNVATQLVLDTEIPYDGDVSDIELPTAVAFDYNGETVTLAVTWNTDSFIFYQNIQYIVFQYSAAQRDVADSFRVCMYDAVGDSF